MTKPAVLDQGDPTVDARAFRRALGQFATGVTVIATSSDGRPAGVTANSFSSLSLDPPLVLWSIARTSRSFETFRQASHFAVSILAADQIDVSQKLSGSSEDKFAGVDWSSGIGGSPLICGAVATLECSLETFYEGGDHIILIGRVARYARYAADVLLYAQGQYGIVEEHPALKEAQQVTRENTPAAPDTPVSTLLYLAHHYSSAAFEKYRREEGISLAQSRVLNALQRDTTLSFERLVRQVYLTERTVEDAVGELLQRGCLLRDMAGGLALTTGGVALVQTIRRKVEAYERQLFSGVPAQQLAATKELLTGFIDRLTPQLSAEDA